MRYFLIAGEASGDMLGASLMRGLLLADPDAEFQYWGGDEMQQVAPGLLRHFREVSIMGFVEVLMKLRTIRKNFRQCEAQLLAFQPHVVILIDYPGFNLRMAAFAKRNNLKTVYFIAPKIWAWNEKRGKKLEHFVDLLLLIFPFEPTYFKKWKVNSLYVGNPMYEEISRFMPDPTFKERHQLEHRKIIALLPGSRKQEISRMLPVMAQLTEKFPNHQFVVAGAPGMDPDFYKPWMKPGLQICFGETRQLLHAAEAAVVCSGTATLETALMKTPQVCAYAANPISYRIAVTFVKVKYISLVNLNMDAPVLTELIQKDFTLDQLSSELEKVMPEGSERKRMMENYQQLENMFIGHQPSKEAAQAILKLLT